MTGGDPIKVLDLRIEFFNEIHTKDRVNSIGIIRNFINGGAVLNDDRLVPFEFGCGFLMTRIIGFSINRFAGWCFGVNGKK